MKPGVIITALKLGLLTEIVASFLSVVCLSLGDSRCVVSGWTVAGAMLQFPGWYLEFGLLRWGISPRDSIALWSFWSVAIIFVMQGLCWSAAWFLRLIWHARRSMVAEPGGAADGSQPSPSETNSTSSARRR